MASDFDHLAEYCADITQQEESPILLEAEQASSAALSSDEHAENVDRTAQQTPSTARETDRAGESPVRMKAEILPVINYAMQHNGAAVVRSIAIENTTDTPIEDVQLRLTASPEFALPFTRHIDLLPAKTTVMISQIEMILNGAYLANTTEKIAGVLHASLQSAGKEIAFSHTKITVLAFDEWHGLGLYPELLAAFVTPNHPELARIIARATEFMGQWTGDTSMDGYQSQDPNRVLHQAAAIFTAIKEQAIAYINPPASFEQRGQRVRLCDMVLQQKLGTCLDLTLLYASCLEAVGLHPLLIATVGHIFIGVWLEEQMFPECVQDDFSLITKRLASGVNEIAVAETTFVTTGRDRSFDDARRQGEDNMVRMSVECIVDVHRARMSHISPLPQRVRMASGFVIEHDTSFQKENMIAPTQLDETIVIDPDAQDENIPKKVQWERKLLNLDMRNTLLNLRMTKTQIPVLTGSLDELENALADGSEYTILPRPADMQVAELTFETLYETGASVIIKAEFENKRLRSVLTEGELNRSIKELYRAAKTALEETGANTLYLALGMLRWFENKRSTKARYAPIILIPIEMVRKSAAQGYVIRLRDDEPRINVTLLEKLKQDFGIVIGGVDPLPEDAHGIDIRRVLTILRKAVMEQDRWDVLETAGIGIFSFSQFVMWNDIRSRTDDLLRNKIVRSLLEGRLCWDAQPLQITDRVSEDNVLLPMPADASQLFAIRAACSGESFVLHGPPGTGKSQTITSLIANALAQGRSVLFVAEKMAALEVVQKRLERIGIGPFCLELHSNKSKKKDVLEQLRKAAEVTKTQTAEEYLAKAEQLAAMRGELDAYARQLHEMQKCGSSLYELINEYERCADAVEIARFERDFVCTLTKAAIQCQQLCVERMIAAAKETGHPGSHPLRMVGCTQYDQNIRENLQTTVEAYAAQIRAMRGHVQQMIEPMGMPQPNGADALQRLYDLACRLLCWYDMPAAWAKTAFPQLYFEEVIALAQHSICADELERQLLERFDPNFLMQDGQQLFAQFAQVSSKRFLSKAMGMKKLRRLLNAYAKTPVAREAVRTHIVMLRDQQAERRAAAELLGKYGQDLGAFYHGEATDWNQLAQLAAQAQVSAQALYDLQGNYDLMHKFGGDAHIRDAVCGICGGMTAFCEAKESCDGLLGIVQKEQEDWLDGQLALCRSILTHAHELKEWIAFAASAEEAKSLGLSNVVAGYELGDDVDVLAAYKKALLHGLIANIIDAGDALSRFSGAVFNEKIRQYRHMDEEWTRLSQQEAYCRLASKVPNFTQEAAHSSELGILQRCIKSGGRGVSIRRLFDQIPNLLPRLCPCMLMSPISAAQYLDPKREPFDIVVFDEASQLPTCKAIGVLARGKDAVIVGDPKQMPPTSFFATNAVDEDNLEAEDLESILDDCLALNMPQSHLLWHYRSRHESLIAFSNSHFYENKLFTFPSVNDRTSKVRVVHVDGAFDRGRTRTNRAEAEAVVQEIKRRCKDPALSGQSLGVVTFNISQQHLIDDLLNEACAKDAELEKWAYDAQEPVFIKNLENVQGDERDVILFSIGFGPDENGKVYMNFGPLNRDGGWRRLNVAVSRARCEMLVFSTLRSEQLDLNRTKAEGVAALRSFLEYAEGRALALEETDLRTERESFDGIAVSICQALKEQGYETDICVGRSAYRIDIGVVDPRSPDTYLLGIMLDGSSYGAAKTTRDREIAQISVLHSLGWNILRVWCMDWWDDRQKELSRILRRLQELQSEEQTPVPATQAVTAQDAAAQETKEWETLAQVQADVRQSDAAPPITRSAPVYKTARITARDISADQFVEPRFIRDIQSKIEVVLDEEAPVSRTLLVRRVVQSYGISRTGSRIQAHMADLLQRMQLRSTEQDDVVFYWKNQQEPDAYVGLRVSADGDSRRDARDVPVQEVANAIYTVLYEQISMAQEDLLRETAKKLGYTRLGGNVLSQLELGVRYAQNMGGITLGMNGAYVLSAEGTARAEATLQSFC